MYKMKEEGWEKYVALFLHTYSTLDEALLFIEECYEAKIWQFEFLDELNIHVIEAYEQGRHIDVREETAPYFKSRQRPKNDSVL